MPERDDVFFTKSLPDIRQLEAEVAGNGSVFPRQQSIARVVTLGGTERFFDPGISHLDGTEEPLVVRFNVELPHIVSETASRVLLPTSVFASAATNRFAASAVSRSKPSPFPPMTTSRCGTFSETR